MRSIDVYFTVRRVGIYDFNFKIRYNIYFILTDLAVGSGFTKRASASLFVSAVERAGAFATLQYAQSWRSCGNGYLSFDVLYKPNTVLRIHFIGIDKRQSDISFELFDLIRYRIVSYEIHIKYKYNNTWLKSYIQSDLHSPTCFFTNATIQNLIFKKKFWIYLETIFSNSWDFLYFLTSVSQDKLLIFKWQLLVRTSSFKII